MDGFDKFMALYAIKPITDLAALRHITNNSIRLNISSKEDNLAHMKIFTANNLLGNCLFSVVNKFTGRSYNIAMENVYIFEPGFMDAIVISRNPVCCIDAPIPEMMLSPDEIKFYTWEELFRGPITAKSAK